MLSLVTSGSLWAITILCLPTIGQVVVVSMAAAASPIAVIIWDSEINDLWDLLVNSAPVGNQQILVIEVNSHSESLVLSEQPISMDTPAPNLEQTPSLISQVLVERRDVVITASHNNNNNTDAEAALSKLQAEQMTAQAAEKQGDDLELDHVKILAP